MSDKNKGRPKGSGQPTAQQKRAVDNIISGEFDSVAAAMRDAGYSEYSSRNPKQKLAKRAGVRAYLQKLDGKAREKWDMSLKEKVWDTYLEGLDATKLVGRDAIEHPDFTQRRQYADRFAEFFEWLESARGDSPAQQFNFFAVPEAKRRRFNENFQEFVKDYYGDD